MKVRSTAISNSDHISSEVFFDALMNLYQFEHALDMFARDGAITVSKYHYRVPLLDAWELGPEHEMSLRKYTSEVKIGCSYKTCQTAQPIYDLVVVDTPQGLHHDYRNVSRVEHFDAMRAAAYLLKDGKGVIVLYVNKAPYNKDEVGSHGYDEYEEYDFDAWMEERKKFYGLHQTGQRLTEEAAIMAYRRHFNGIGFAMKRVMIVPCFSDVEGVEPYAFRIALELEKR